MDLGAKVNKKLVFWSGTILAFLLLFGSFVYVYFSVVLPYPWASFDGRPVVDILPTNTLDNNNCYQIYYQGAFESLDSVDEVTSWLSNTNWQFGAKLPESNFQAMVRGDTFTQIPKISITVDGYRLVGTRKNDITKIVTFDTLILCLIP